MDRSMGLGLAIVALACGPVLAGEPASTPDEVRSAFTAVSTSRPIGAKSIPLMETHRVSTVSDEDIEALGKRKIGAKNIVPTPRKRAQSVETVDALIPFKLDSYELVGNATQMLDEVVKSMKENEGLRLAVNGHTDSKTGTPEHNLQLSHLRATSVMKYLIEKGGIDRQRFEGHGYGPAKPKFPEDTPVGVEKNRRVEFEILKK